MHNPDMLENSHHLDALIRAAKVHPTPEIIQKIIDKELDYNGNWVGFAESNYLWHKIAS